MRLSIFLFTLSLSLQSARPAVDDVPKFQLITLVLDNKSIILARCNTETGETWYRLGAQWRKGVEETPVAPSRYGCVAKAHGNNGWLLARIDENTGRLWTLQGEVWRVILEPIPAVRPMVNQVPAPVSPQTQLPQNTSFQQPSFEQQSATGAMQ